jgi:hypothetical protein
MRDKARRLAAELLTQRGQEADACIVQQGGGDDFPEVRLALALQQALAPQLQRYERALQTYADIAFWDAEIAEATLAFHDQGAVARAALDGKELFALHRD